MTQQQSPIQQHLSRPTTRAAARRSNNRLIANINSVVGDIINPTGIPSEQEVAGGGGGGTSAAFHGAEAFLVTLTSIGTGPTTLSFDGTRVDSDAMWSAGSPTKLTVATTGYYEIYGEVNFQVYTATTQYTFFLHYNGSSNPAVGNFLGTTPPGGGGEVSTVSCRIVRKLTAGDFFEMQVLSSANDGSVQAVMSLVKVGT